jgi:hypothetical protein
MVLQVGLQPVLGHFGCFLGGQATKSTVPVRPKTFFVLILDRNGICLPQHPGFGSKLSSKGKPGTCALFRNLLISSGAQSFQDCLTSFVLYLDIFVNINGLFTLGETRDDQLFKECRKTFL